MRALHLCWNLEVPFINSHSLAQAALRTVVQQAVNSNHLTARRCRRLPIQSLRTEVNATGLIEPTKVHLFDLYNPPALSVIISYGVLGFWGGWGGPIFFS